eukprot:SAG31_NODE_2817_length_5042_cov_32.133522_5_plen_384_part_00
MQTRDSIECVATSPGRADCATAAPRLGTAVAALSNDRRGRAARAVAAPEPNAVGLTTSATTTTGGHGSGNKRSHQALHPREALNSSSTSESSDDDSALCWRNLQPLFEEERLVDGVAHSMEITVGGQVGSLRLQQMPRLASRLDDETDKNEDLLGCATEAESATGAVAWDSSVVVAAHLAQRHQTRSASEMKFPGVAVELGSGVGLLSAALVRLGYATIATDRQEILPLLRKNLAANCCAADGDPSGDKQGPALAPYAVVCHMWGASVTPLLTEADKLAINVVGEPAVNHPITLVVAVDCVYDTGAVAPLLASLVALGAGSGIETLVAVDESYRRPSALALFLGSLAPLGLAAVEETESLDSSNPLWKASVRLFRLVSLQLQS